MVQFKSTTDIIVEKGHLIFSTLATGATHQALFSGGSPINLTLNNLSDRAAALGKLFERWQLLQLTVTYFPTVASTVSGAIAVGIIDEVVEPDDNGVITSFAAATSCRTSLNTQVFAPASMTWRPVDKSKIYYCDSVSAVANAPEYRFSAPASIFAFGSSAALNGNATLGYLRFDYVIKFMGAITPSTISRQVVFEAPEHEKECHCTSSTKYKTITK